MKNPPAVEKLGIRYEDLDPYGYVNNAVHSRFFAAEAGEFRSGTDWFLPAVAGLEGRPEEDFAPEDHA